MTTPASSTDHRGCAADDADDDDARPWPCAVPLILALALGAWVFLGAVGLAAWGLGRAVGLL